MEDHIELKGLGGGVTGAEKKPRAPGCGPGTDQRIIGEIVRDDAKLDLLVAELDHAARAGLESEVGAGEVDRTVIEFHGGGPASAERRDGRQGQECGWEVNAGHRDLEPESTGTTPDNDDWILAICMVR